MAITELIRHKAFLRGLSSRTIQTYIYVVEKFLRLYHKDHLEITKNDIEKHCLMLIENNHSTNTLNVHLNALKFFYEEVLNRQLTINIRYCRVPKKLPEFLSQEETIQILSQISNPKHLLMIKMLYSAGLRISELLNLKVNHLNLDQNYGWVRNGKGKKDRVFVIADKLKIELTDWINKLTPEDYLFSYLGRKMSSQTIRKVLSLACRNAKINKNVHPHTLRHSFATHLLENGYSITELQHLLGHNKLDTTLIYAHLTQPKFINVKSPFDTLPTKIDSKVESKIEPEGNKI